MSRIEKEPLTLERRLANLLGFGTLIASGALAFGLLLTVLTSDAWPRDFLLLLGIGLLIALPLVRLVVTGVVFLFCNEPGYAAVAGLVLAIVTASLLYLGGRGG